jgi:hypothetical protein
MDYLDGFPGLVVVLSQFSEGNVSTKTFDVELHKEELFMLQQGQ